MTVTARSSATLEHLEPKNLVIGQNIRSADHVDLNPEFVEDIKTRGVIEPIIAYRGEEDSVVVYAGQRRVLASILAGLGTVPVIVHPTKPDTPDRIGDQWAENHQRTAMTLADEAAAVDELALFGLPASEIARQLHLDVETVDAAVKIAKSPAAKQATTVYSLSLEYAELVADVEATGGEAVDATIEGIVSAAAEGDDVEHVRYRIESERARVKVLADATAEYEAKGIRVVEKPDDHGPMAPEWAGLFDLVDVDEDNHVECPGRAVYLRVHQSFRDDQEPWRVVAKEICTDWKANGHEKHTWASSTSAPTKVPAAELPDKQREAAKAERRRVIDSNKAWKEATNVRAKWLLTFGAHKQPRVGAEKFITAHLVTWLGTSATHLPLVGLDRDGVEKELKRASAARSTHLTTCIVVASIEDHLTDDAWRSQLAVAGPYLETLAKWGYGLADIEKRIIEDAKAAAKGKKS